MLISYQDTRQFKIIAYRWSLVNVPNAPGPLTRRCVCLTCIFLWSPPPQQFLHMETVKLDFRRQLPFIVAPPSSPSPTLTHTHTLSASVSVCHKVFQDVSSLLNYLWSHFFKYLYLMKCWDFLSFIPTHNVHIETSKHTYTHTQA